MPASHWVRRCIVGATAAAALAALGGFAAQPASASATCLLWIDAPYFNDETGASGYTSTCSIEAWGAGDGAAASDGSAPGASGGMTAVHIPAPPPTLDPRCTTHVSSNLDQNLDEGTHYSVGFPAGSTKSNPNIVYVTVDPNLTTGHPEQPWMAMVASALGQWQYQLNAAGVPIRFLLDATPTGAASAQFSMFSALGMGDLMYHLHVRAPESDESADSDVVAHARQLWGDGNGRTLYEDIAVFKFSLPASSLTTAIAHEVGHSLGLNDQSGKISTSVMAGNLNSGAAQPTCSDAWSVARAASQDLTTGFSVLDSHL